MKQNRGSRWKMRADPGQRAIMAALRAAGYSVQSLHRMGSGVPDLLAGKSDRNYLIEVKSPKEALSTAQREWHAKWRGQIVVLESVEETMAWANRTK